MSSSWGAGVAWRKGEVGRTLNALPVNNQSSLLRQDVVVFWKSSPARVLPIIVWDAEVELGDTPGTRFMLGIHSQIELGEGTDVATGSGTFGRDTTGSGIAVGGGNVRAWGSPAFMIGPKLGLIVGH